MGRDLQDTLNVTMATLAERQAFWQQVEAEKQRELQVLYKTFRKYSKVYVWALSDIQYGAASCQLSKFLRYVEWAKKTPNVLIMLLGDLMENAIPTHIPEAMFEQTKSPAQQFSELYTILKPLRHKILFGITGNHELRTWKKVGFDPTEWFCRELRIPYREFGCYQTIQAGDQSYLLAVHHGASAGVANAKIDLDKLRKIYEGAEIYCAGHNHFLYAQAFQRFTYDAERQKKMLRDIWYVRSGSFMGYAKYAESRLMEPIKTGSAILKLYVKDHMIDVSQSDKIGRGENDD
ncbi:metallophosphoesterase [Candidatus Woesearchaeota archaeon]|nr:metallophosphoesterase [Candidatus Woesearchaeota archaeon]